MKERDSKEKKARESRDARRREREAKAQAQGEEESESESTDNIVDEASALSSSSSSITAPEEFKPATSTPATPRRRRELGVRHTTAKEKPEPKTTSKREPRAAQANSEFENLKIMLLAPVGMAVLFLILYIFFM